MASMDEQAFGITMLGRPLFTSLFVGLILGDVQQGVIVGAALESMFMGAIMVGAAVPPEVYASGVLGCAFAVITGTGTATAVALALPVSVFLLYSVITLQRVLSQPIWDTTWEPSSCSSPKRTTLCLA